MKDLLKGSPLASKTTNSMAGFSLMEMLVVLVMISVLSGLLISGIGHVVLVKERVYDHALNSSVASMSRYWFCDVVKGLVPDHPLAESPFEGRRDSFNGLTLMSLGNPPGLPIQVSVNLKVVAGGSRLVYAEKLGEEWVLYKWPEQEISFAYLDDAGNWYSQWPPIPDSRGPQIPTAIKIVGTDKNAIWVASHLTRNLPRTEMRDFL